MALEKIFRDGEYDIVHSHLDAMNAYILKIAKRSGIRIRISHSHNTQHLTQNKLKLMFNHLIKKTISRYATHLFACSEKAGIWLYGSKKFKQGKVTIIKNSVEYEKFLFDKQTRELLKSKMNLGDSFIIGHVGRFDHQKNHLYLIDIFNDLQKKIIDSKLILIGDGILRDKIEEKIKRLNLDDKVILLGYQDNINKLLNVFDLFIFPSRFEGLGISVVEAQINGIPCLVSEEVPREVIIHNKINFIPLDSNKTRWVNSSIDFSKLNRVHIDSDKIINSGYSIIESAKLLEKIYQKMTNK